MIHSLSTLLLGFIDRNLINQLVDLAPYGIKHIEIQAFPEQLPANDPAYLARIRDELIARDIQVASIHSPYNFYEIRGYDISHPEADERKKAIDSVRQSIELARFLDCSVVVLHPSAEYFEDRKQQRLHIKESLKEIVDIATANNVRIALENLNPGYFGDHIDDMHDFLSPYTSSELTMCLDVGHANLTGDLDLYLERMGDRIGHLHLSDNDGTFDQHRLPLTVSMNWEQLCPALARLPLEPVWTTEVYKIGDLPAAFQLVRDTWDRLTQLAAGESPCTIKAHGRPGMVEDTPKAG